MAKKELPVEPERSISHWHSTKLIMGNKSIKNTHRKAETDSELLKLLVGDVTEWVESHDRPFTNERDLQVKLAMWLEKTTDHYTLVDTEYCVPTEELRRRNLAVPHKADDKAAFPSFPWHNQLSLDIVVARGDEYAVVELKYFTRPIEWDERIFGEPLLSTTTLLKDKAATDAIMYDYCKDIRRIEYVTKAFRNVAGGVALIVANNHNLWKEPKGSPRYLPFSLHGGKVFKQGFHNWPEGGSDDFKKDKPGFITEADYEWHWEDCTIPARATNGDNFRYLLTVIKKNDLAKVM